MYVDFVQPKRSGTCNQCKSTLYSQNGVGHVTSVCLLCAAKTEWDMQLGFRSVPIRATAVGMQYKFGLIRPFNHTYDLYKFEPYIHSDDFEVNTTLLSCLSVMIV